MLLSSSQLVQPQVFREEGRDAQNSLIMTVTRTATGSPCRALSGAEATDTEL